MQAFCNKKKNSDSSKTEGSLALKSIFSETTTICVCTYIPNFKYGHLGSWSIKSTLYQRSLYQNSMFEKNKTQSVKTISIHFVLSILFVLTLAFDRAVWYGNAAVSVIEKKKKVSVIILSTQHGTLVFWKMFSFFRNFVLKL